MRSCCEWLISAKRAALSLYLRVISAKSAGCTKGARRRKNPFEAAIDVLAFCRIVFLHKTSETLDILTEAKLLRRFRSASTDLQRLYAAYYVVEMLLAMTDEDNPNPELFELAWQTLVDIDEGLPREPCLIQFECAAANMLGQSPALATCVECEWPSMVRDGCFLDYDMAESSVLIADERKSQWSVSAGTPWRF